MERFIKRQKISDDLNKLSNTQFEDLPNEIIYDILDFLDIAHVYAIFFNLNTRFRNLLADSIFPIKINLSVMSKSTFKHYYQHIITFHKHRIRSLRLSNLFTIDFVFPSIRFISKLVRLETLHINNLQSEHVQKLLKYLVSLPNLSSLTLIITDTVDDRTKLYRRIFRLSALKYCKVSLPKLLESDPFVIATDHFSSLEHLVLHNSCDLDELLSLLSYVPQLRRLSICELYGSFIDPIESRSIILNSLTHLSINKTNMIFDELEVLIKNHFQQIQVFHFSRCFDEDFLNASRWERLISTHMSQLRIFDLYAILSSYDRLKLENLASGFYTPFWFKRQWFFSHQIYSTSISNRITLVSTNPYRRKSYRICGENNDAYEQEHRTNQFSTVQLVRIEDEKAMNTCRYYFLNATELNLSYHLMDENQTHLPTVINRILPLQQITKLVINIDFYRTKKIIEFLCFTSNIHTFSFNCTSLCQADLNSIQQDENFRIVSKKNKIINLILTTRCTFEATQLLLHLCSQIQHLTINILKNDFEGTLRFLLTKDNCLQLCSLYLQNVHEEQMIILNRLLSEEKLVDQYFMKVSDILSSDVYLWC